MLPTAITKNDTVEHSLDEFPWHTCQPAEHNEILELFPWPTSFTLMAKSLALEISQTCGTSDCQHSSVKPIKDNRSPCCFSPWTCLYAAKLWYVGQHPDVTNHSHRRNNKHDAPRVHVTAVLCLSAIDFANAHRRVEMQNWCKLLLDYFDPPWRFNALISVCKQPRRWHCVVTALQGKTASPVKSEN